MKNIRSFEYVVLHLRQPELFVLVTVGKVVFSPRPSATFLRLLSLFPHEPRSYITGNQGVVPPPLPPAIRAVIDRRRNAGSSPPSVIQSRRNKKLARVSGRDPIENVLIDDEGYVTN